MGVAHLRTVVEGEDDLLQAQKVIGLVVLEAEAGAPVRVDLHDAGDAQRVGVGACPLCGCRILGS